MSSATEEEVKLELKYCEVCGGLWLRASGSLQPYCVSCQAIVAELAPARRRGGQSGRPA